MSDFSAYTGWAIPEGAVTQITDAAGNVLWALSGGKKPIELEVEKITDDTYAGGTTYTGEQFILLDIYPESGKTVKVTFCGVTKTIKDTSGAETPNAQQVFFGTFNGVTDEVPTPASGTLTIEGNYRAFGCGTYKKYNSTTLKSVSYYCACITIVKDFGEIVDIPSYAFYQCKSLSISPLPEGVESIGAYAFYHCENLNIQQIPEGVKTIGTYAFAMPRENFKLCGMYDGILILPSTLLSIGEYAFTCSSFSTGSGSISTYYSGYLKVLKMLATAPPTISGENSLGSTYYNTGPERIEIPSGCLEAYRTASGWSYYSGQMVEVS